jgi:lipopolysaccharide export system permease protein
MFKITQRYLASTFILPFVLSTVFFITFLLIFKLFSLIRIVTNKGVEIWVVFELMGHIALSFIPMAVPLSVLFATMYTLNKMSEDSEIVAMRSFGLTKLQLFTPFLILGFIVAVLTNTMGREMIPYSKTLFKNTIIQLTSKGMMTDIKAGQFFTEIPKVTLFAEDVKGNGNILHEVFIRMDNDNGLEQLIYAEKGVLIKQSISEYLTPSMRLHLTNGNIVKRNSQKQEVEKVLFEQYDFPIVSGGDLYGFVTKDSMRTNNELKEVINQYRKDKENIEIDGVAEHERGAYGGIIERLPRSELEYWGRINAGIQILTFVLIGFGLGIKKGRGRTRNSGVMGLVVLTTYYALFFLGISMARKQQIPTIAAVFAPTLIAAIIGSYFYRKVDWLS